MSVCDNELMARTVFIDIDGTLLSHDHKVPESAAQALQDALQSGTRLVFCTGRNAGEVFPDLWAHGFSAMVGGGGAYVEVDGKLIFDHRIGRDLIDSASAWMDERDLPWIWQTPDLLWGTQRFWDAFTAPSESDEVEAGRQDFISKVKHRVRQGKPENASKAVVIIPAGSEITFEAVRDHFEDDFTVVAGSMEDTFGQSVELMPAGINKATGMFKLADYLGIPHDEIVAIGDSANDLEMIREAPLGIAMGNSVPEILAAADWITTDVSEDGLANALRYAKVID